MRELAITNDVGTLTSQQRYLPFGQVRTDLGIIAQTDYGYTGQRDLGMGLMDYKARFYSPALGRFVQPDTIIPSGIQGLNRYSYVLNNPINANDPTGHKCVGEPEECLRDKGKPINGAGTHSSDFSGGDVGGEVESSYDYSCANIVCLPVVKRTDPTTYQEPNTLSTYCEDISSIACLAMLAQDLAIVVDVAGAITEFFIVAGACEAGLAGCAGGVLASWEVWTVSQGNTAESVFSIASLVLTGIDDFHQHGELGENTLTSFVTAVVGGISPDPIVDLGIDIYTSGYNHGFFNGIITIMSGGPLIKK